MNNATVETARTTFGTNFGVDEFGNPEEFGYALETLEKHGPFRVFRTLEALEAFKTEKPDYSGYYASGVTAEKWLGALGYSRIRSVVVSLNYDNDESREVSIAVPEMNYTTTLSELAAFAVHFADDVARDDDYYRDMEFVGILSCDLDIDDPAAVFSIVFRVPRTGFENVIHVTFGFDEEEE